MEQRVIYVPAHFRPLHKKVVIEVPTGETKKGIFGSEKQLVRKETKIKQVGWSDSKIDGARLAEDLECVVKKLNRDGFKVDSVTPVVSGAYDYKYRSQGISSSKRLLSETESVSGGASFGYGYGYSHTESLIVVGTRIE